jgi:multisubunit Na+/H+ antiporter MnhB subunit
MFLYGDDVGHGLLGYAVVRDLEGETTYLLNIGNHLQDKKYCVTIQKTITTIIIIIIMMMMMMWHNSPDGCKPLLIQFHS